MSPVDFAANKRMWLIRKEREEEGKVAKEMPEDMGAARRRELTPRADMSNDELRDQQAELSAAMEIEVLPGSPLRFPADFPADITLYGDPVNRRLPNDTEGRAQAAVGRARQTMDRYSDEQSKRVVWERVIRGLMRHGQEHRFDPDDPLDRMLPRDLQEQLQKASNDHVLKSIEMAEAIAAAFARDAVGHRASMVQKNADAQRELLEQKLADERSRRISLEKEIARLKKQRHAPPAPSGLPYGENGTAADEPLSWGHDLASEATTIARNQG